MTTSPVSSCVGWAPVPEPPHTMCVRLGVMSSGPQQTCLCQRQDGNSHLGVTLEVVEDVKVVQRFVEAARVYPIKQ